MSAALSRSLDWDRIADEVELRTSSLLSENFRRGAVGGFPFRDQAPSIPSASVAAVWEAEEKAASYRKYQERLEEETATLRAVGSSQTQRIGALEQTVAELVVELNAVKAHCLSSSSLVSCTHLYICSLLSIYLSVH